MRRQIPADGFPACPAIAGSKDDARTDVEHLGIEARHHDRSVPIPALAFASLAQRRDCLPLERSEIDAIRASVLRLDNHRARIGRIDTRVEAVAAADVEAVAVRDAGPNTRRARHAPMAVVLKPAADRVGILHVSADFVELADWQVVAKQPGDATIP